MEMLSDSDDFKLSLPSDDYVNQLKSEFSDIFLEYYLVCMHFSLVDNIFTAVTLKDFVKDVIGIRDKATTSIEKLIKFLVSEMYQQRMMEFCDLTTLNQRMKDKNSIFMEFYSSTGYWCRARFTAFKKDEKGFITEVIFSIGFIDSEVLSLRNRLQFEETFIECIKYLTLRNDFKAAISKVLKIFCEYYSADRCYIFKNTLDEDGKAVLCENIYDYNNSENPSSHKKILSTPISVVTRLSRYFEKSGKFSISNVAIDLDISSEEGKFLLSNGVFSLILYPFRNIDGKLSGFIGITNPKNNLENEILLQSTAALIEQEIIREDYKEKLYNLSYKDGLTSLFNRQAYIEKIKKIKKQKSKNVAVIFSDINGLKKANDEKGHKAGDELILNAVSILKKTFSDFEIFRIGGDEFVLIKTGLSEEEFTDRFNSFISDENNEKILSCGEVWFENPKEIEEKMKFADDKMYQRKSEYYKKFNLNRRK